jgi:hypothetical protein
MLLLLLLPLLLLFCCLDLQAQPLLHCSHLSETR